MNQSTRVAERVLILSHDGDPTIRAGDWLRLWNSLGGGIAHDVWVGANGIVYENSGPGGHVRHNYLTHVFAGRVVIHIISRTTPSEFAAKFLLAERLIGTPWSAFYNCQDFASQVANGKAESFQRDGAVALTTIIGGFLLWANHQSSPPRKGRVRRR
jgi:hypothetical protein